MRRLHEESFTLLQHSLHEGAHRAEEGDAHHRASFGPIHHVGGGGGAEEKDRVAEGQNVVLEERVRMPVAPVGGRVRGSAASWEIVCLGGQCAGIRQFPGK